MTPQRTILDNKGIWTMLLNLVAQSRVQIHCHNFDYLEMSSPKTSTY